MLSVGWGCLNLISNQYHSPKFHTHIYISNSTPLLEYLTGILNLVCPKLHHLELHTPRHDPPSHFFPVVSWHQGRKSAWSPFTYLLLPNILELSRLFSFFLASFIYPIRNLTDSAFNIYPECNPVFPALSLTLQAKPPTSLTYSTGGPPKWPPLLAFFSPSPYCLFNTAARVIPTSHKSLLCSRPLNNVHLRIKFKVLATAREALCHLVPLHLSELISCHSPALWTSSMHVLATP